MSDSLSCAEKFITGKLPSMYPIGERFILWNVDHDCDCVPLFADAKKWRLVSVTLNFAGSLDAVYERTSE